VSINYFSFFFGKRCALIEPLFHRYAIYDNLFAPTEKPKQPEGPLHSLALSRSVTHRFLIERIYSI
jgi:hypothetical protein